MKCLLKKNVKRVGLLAVFFPILVIAGEDRAPQLEALPLLQEAFSPTWWRHRVDNQLLIGNFDEALLDGMHALELYPTSVDVQKSYIRALINCKMQAQAISFLDRAAPTLKEDYALLEEIGWSILQEGMKSDQYGTRLVALIGNFLTNDAKGVSLIRGAMHEENGILRSVAVKLAANFKDNILKEEVLRLLKEEHLFEVRLEAIKASGAMQIKESVLWLKNFLKKEDISLEERAYAIEALVNIYDKIELDELKELFKSPYFALRSLGLEFAAHFQVDEAKDDLLALLKDPISDVRLSALKALYFYFNRQIANEVQLSILKELFKDPNPQVAIMAAYLTLFIDKGLAVQEFRHLIFKGGKECAVAAAAALGCSGELGGELCLDIISKKGGNSYVKVNLALGLLGQRVATKRCCDILFDFLKNKRERISWDKIGLFPFKIFSQTRIKHIDQIPHYPESVDSMTQLELFSILASADDPRAEEAIKGFLQKKGWGITGMAAATLLREGDEATLIILRKLLNEKSVEIRLQAALVLAFLGKDESVIPILERAYEEGDSEMKMRILEAMGDVATKDSIPFLLKVLREQFTTLKVAGASALIRALNR